MTYNQTNRNKINALYRELKSRTMTKADVMDFLGCDERGARAFIHEVAIRVPVISTSDKKGYRVADRTKPHDVKEAKHAMLENEKRADEILKRNAPLKEFFRQIESNERVTV